MIFQIAVAIAVHVLLPAYFIYIVLTDRSRDQVGWLLKAVTAAGFALFITLGGRWDWFGRYLRFVPAALIAAAVVYSFVRFARHRPFFTGRAGRAWLGTGMAAAEAGLVIIISVLVLNGTFAPADPVRLQFPLQDGSYYVGQGGGSFFLNYHHVDDAQAYALDIVELNQWQARADGLYPDKRDEYEVYGDTVYAPCGGTVISAANDRPGFAPPEREPEHPAGNHVMIHCGDVSVLLAHLQRDSVMVEEGEEVAAGESLGRVGNSGNTTEPHLHIHAVAGRPDGVLQGEAVPMIFEGEFLVRNDVVGRPRTAGG